MRFRRQAILGCIFILFVGTLFSTPAYPDRVQEVLRSSHEQRPDWTFSPPIPGEEHKFYYFVGISPFSKNEPQARNRAMTNARNKVAEFIGTKVQVKTESSRRSKDSGETVRSRLVRQNANALVSQYHPKEWYVKKVLIDDRVRWKTFVLLAIPQTVVERKIKKSKDQSDQLVNESDFPHDEIKLSVIEGTRNAQSSETLRTFFESNLSEKDPFTLIDRNELEPLYENKELREAGLNSPGDRARIGRMHGTDALLFADTITIDNNQYLSTRLISVPTSRMANTLVSTTDYALQLAVEQSITNLKKKLRDRPNFFSAQSNGSTPEEITDKLRKPRSNPSVFVNVTENHNYETTDRTLVEGLLEQILNESGYRVLLSKPKDASPDIMIEGKASTQFGIKRAKLFSVKGFIQLEASKPSEQTLIASETAEAVGIDVTEPDAARQALDRALEQVAPNLMQKLYHEVD